MARASGGKAAGAARADLLEREPGAMHQALSDFIQAQTGYTPDLKTVQLTTALRRSYQKSPSGQTNKAAATDGVRPPRKKAAAAAAGGGPRKKAAAAKKAAPRGRKAAAAVDEQPF